MTILKYNFNLFHKFDYFIAFIFDYKDDIYIVQINSVIKKKNHFHFFT